MKIKIDENARLVINHCGVDEQVVERELLNRLIASGYVSNDVDWSGAALDEALDVLPEEEGSFFCVVAEVLGSRGLDASTLDALSKCIVMGDGDCEECGAEMDIDTDATEWHYESEDGYPKQVIDSETYVCPVCGRRIVKRY